MSAHPIPEPEFTPERKVWLQPLADAAESAKDDTAKATLITPWVNSDGTLAPEHTPYATCLSGAMARRLPWLPELLRRSAALVYAAPGEFWFALPADPAVRYLVPEMVPDTHKLPWAPDGQDGLPH